MNFSAYSGKALAQRTSCLVIGVYEPRELGTEGGAVDRATGGRLSALLRRGDFAGRAGESLLLTELPRLRGNRVLLVGLGARAQYNRRGWKRALSTAVAALARTRIASASFALERPQDRDFDDYTLARAAAECCGAALYRINDLKTGKRPPAPALERASFGPFTAARLADARRGLADGAGSRRQRRAAAQSRQPSRQRLHAALPGRAGREARPRAIAGCARARSTRRRSGG